MIGHSSSHLRAADFAYINRIARTNFAGEGPLAMVFRENLAKVFGRREVVLSNNGAAALELALHLLRKQAPTKRDVVVSAYVCPAVVNAIVREGLRPLFADVMPDALNLDIQSVRARMDHGSTLAVVCTHVGGIPDDCQAAEFLGSELISDCAQSIGATVAGRSVAQYGRFAVLSFGSTKPLTAGTGGALMMDDAELRDRARRRATSELGVEDYRSSGFEDTYGQHFPDLNAGLGLAQLKRFDAFLQRRRLIAKQYDKVLVEAGCTVPGSAPTQSERNAYRYYFLSDRSTEWVALLRRNAIDARASIAHDMTAYFPRAGRLPGVKRNAERVVSVPIYPRLTALQVKTIVMALRLGVESGLQ
jgi:aminotransferase